MRRFLLEDDPVHAAHFAASREGSDIGVDHVSSPAALFEALALPDIIVHDWMLPGESGYQVLRQLRDRLGQAIPVLMLTCVDSEAMVIDALEAGADDFLTQPVAHALLRARQEADAGCPATAVRKTSIVRRGHAVDGRRCVEVSAVLRTGRPATKASAERQARFGQAVRGGRRTPRAARRRRRRTTARSHRDSVHARGGGLPR